ncbi:Fc.00g010740.m01.CDS01 [Cosmosporella sp. VM-42]
MFRLNPDLLSRSTAYYLNYYLDTVADLPTVSACMSECLTAWKASGRHCFMVDLAVSSLALAIFSRTHRHPPAAREAFLKYGLLLRVAQEQITRADILTCNQKVIDESLLTTVLMAWYETVTHQPTNLMLNDSLRSLHSWSHYDGGMAILKVWNYKLSHKSPPSSIIKQARRGIVRSALLRHHPIPNWIRDGSRFGENNLDLGFDSILVRVVNLRHAFKNLNRKERLWNTQVKQLIDETRQLDEICGAWATQVPVEWSYKQHVSAKSDSWPRGEFYCSSVYVYARASYAAVWIQYFALRIVIDSTHLRLVQLSNSTQLLDISHQQQHHELMAQLRNSANCLASTIPFCLGRLKPNAPQAPDSSGKLTITLNLDEDIQPALALPIVWPLSLASSLQDFEPEQLLWFRAQLIRLGHVLGDGALLCAGTREWTHEEA